MEKISNFIDANFNYFSNFGASEVEVYSIDEFDSDIIDYLKLNYRFDCRGICIYYVSDYNQIWIENMES
jgi:hypothetical protein